MIEDTEIDRQRSYLIYSTLGKAKSKQNSPNFSKTKKAQKSEFVNFWEFCKNPSKEVFQYILGKNDN